MGLTNYSACYATGLLCARRTLKKFGLDAAYEGNADPEKLGEDFTVEAVDDGPRPFKALLDVGLVRTSSGAKVFGCLKARARLCAPPTPPTRTPFFCARARVSLCDG